MAKLSRRTIARTVAAKLIAEPTQHARWIKMTAAYLIEQNQVSNIDLLVNDIAQEIFEQSGKLHVDVASARPLTDSIRAELKTFLSNATDAKAVTLTEHIDPNLVGGLVARTPSSELDLSVRTTLQQLAIIK